MTIFRLATFGRGANGNFLSLRIGGRRPLITFNEKRDKVFCIITSPLHDDSNSGDNIRLLLHRMRGEAAEPGDSELSDGRSKPDRDGRGASVIRQENLLNPIKKQFVCRNKARNSIYRNEEEEGGGKKWNFDCIFRPILECGAIKIGSRSSRGSVCRSADRLVVSRVASATAFGARSERTHRSAATFTVSLVCMCSSGRRERVSCSSE